MSTPSPLEHGAILTMDALSVADETSTLGDEASTLASAVEDNPIIICNHHNKEGVIAAKGSLNRVALQNFETAARSAVFILSSAAAPATSLHQECSLLQIVSLRGRFSDSAFMFRRLLLLEDPARCRTELLVVVVLHNLAQVLHARGCSEASQKQHDLTRCLKLYEIVLRLVQTNLRLESPELLITVYTNIGHAHYLLENYKETDASWKELPGLLKQLTGTAATSSSAGLNSATRKALEMNIRLIDSHQGRGAAKGKRARKL